MTKNNPTISDKIAQLDQLVAWFDSDEFRLELATNQFEKAQNLAKEIELDLAQFKNKVAVVKASFQEDAE